MSAETRTVVTFASSHFNTSEPKPYFINECCFGDDVANWLIRELRHDGHETVDSPGQEDFGWYLNFKVGGVRHCFVIGHRPGTTIDEGIWVGWIERSRSLLPRLFVGRQRGIKAEAVVAIHRILKRDSSIRNIRWHSKRDFDAGREECSVAEPQLL